MQFKEIIIEVSHNCNLACTMCGFGYKLNPPSPDKFMKKEMFYKLIDSLVPRTEIVRLNGRGESSIHPDFIDMLLYVRNNWPSVGINLFSNMSFTSNKVLHVLKNLNVQLFISLDSTNKITLEKIRCGANYERIISNIKLLQDHHIRPFICMTLQEQNIHEVYEMGTFAFEHDLSIIYNTVRSDEVKYIQGFIDKIQHKTDEIKQDFKKIRDLYHSDKNKKQLKCLIPDQMAGFSFSEQNFTQTHGSLKFCPALNNELCILYDGTVTPCNMFNPYKYGNILNNSIEEIVKSAAYLNFKKEYKQCKYCKNCANLGV